jgi:hypothetical protein
MKQNLVAAQQLFAFMHGDWLRDFRSLESKRIMSSLVLGIYITHLEGRPLYKKKAVQLMRVEDTKTSRKYVGFAIDLGLVTVGSDPDDKRKETLHPTRKLLHLIEKELSAIMPAAQ